MKAEKAYIDDVLIIQPDVFNDARGYFFEVYHKEKFNAFGIEYEFIQDNQSKSMKNTIRGLHYQAQPFTQGKLLRVLEGAIRDIALDIRKGSPTFGKHFSIDITAESHTQIWIPPGFAHGFSVLSEQAVILYKCTAFYSKSHERGIRFDDPALGIDWGVEDPIVSEKDIVLPQFKDAEMGFVYNNE